MSFHHVGTSRSRTTTDATTGTEPFKARPMPSFRKVSIPIRDRRPKGSRPRIREDKAVERLKKSSVEKPKSLQKPSIPVRERRPMKAKRLSVPSNNLACKRAPASNARPAPNKTSLTSIQPTLRKANTYQDSSKVRKSQPITNRKENMPPPTNNNKLSANSTIGDGSLPKLVSQALEDKREAAERSMDLILSMVNSESN